MPAAPIPPKAAAGRFRALLRSLFVENFGLKVFSLLLTLLLWLFVRGAEDVTTTASVPIYYKIPNDRVLVTDVPDQVKIAVSGPWAALQGWNPGDLKVEIDLSKAELGPSIAYVEENQFRFPPSMKLLRITPSQVAVNLAKKGSRLVRVVPLTTGSPAPGYTIKSILCVPDKVMIEGPEAEIGLEEAVVTEEIDVSDQKEPFVISAKPIRKSKNIVFVNRDPVQVTVTIKRDLIERTFPDIPVEVRQSKYACQVDPKEISLTLLGPRSVMERIEPKDVRAYVDASSEEGDHPGTSTLRDVQFDPIHDDVKIKAGSYTVKLIVTHMPKAAGKTP